jgi:hypothetical protein
VAHWLLCSSAVSAASLKMDGSSLTDGPLEPTGASEAVQAFEHACEALQSAEAGARQGAEAHLLQLRAPGAAHEAIELCRRVLLLSGGSARPLAQFHAALTLRDVVMRDWEALSEEPVAGMGGGGVAITGVLREEILHSTVQRLCSPPGAQPFLRQQLLQLVALLHKRAWLMPAAEGGGGAGLQQRALQLCAGGQPPQSQALGLQLLEAVLSEFSFSRLTAVGMTVEFHIEARLTFQRGQLLAYVRAHAVTPCSQRAHTGWGCDPPPPLGTFWHVCLQNRGVHAPRSWNLQVQLAADWLARWASTGVRTELAQPTLVYHLARLGFPCVPYMTVALDWVPVPELTGPAGADGRRAHPAGGGGCGGRGARHRRRGAGLAVPHAGCDPAAGRALRSAGVHGRRLGRSGLEAPGELGQYASTRCCSITCLCRTGRLASALVPRPCALSLPLSSLSPSRGHLISWHTSYHVWCGACRHGVRRGW